MDAMNTVDIVEAPTGSSTGQMRSQVLISSNCDMEAPSPQTQILNSVGAVNYQEMLETKYLNCIHCPMCCRLFLRPEFRSMGGERKEWVSVAVTDVRDFVTTRWCKPMFQEAIIAGLANIKGDVPVCAGCAGFVRRNKRVKDPTLPTHQAVNYIMSGGSKLSPSVKTVTHCIESLAYHFPNNPMLRQASGLAERVQLIIKHQELFYAPTEGHDYLCMLRWVAEGSQHFIVDANFARIVRKYIETHEPEKDWWADKAPPAAACMNCLSSLFKPLRDRIDAIVLPLRKKECRGYSSVLAFSSPKPEVKINQGVDAIQAKGVIIDGATAFCTQCRGVSLLSYEYDCLVKTAAGGYGITPFTDVYYDRVVRLAEAKPTEGRKRKALGI